MKTLILLLTLIISTTSFAQLYIESDPFAYGLGGHSVHIGVQGGGFRFQVGAFGANYPDSFKDNEEFDVYQSGYGAKIDFYGDKPDGAFIGIEYSQTTAKYTLTATEEEVEEDIRLLGVRTGYKMMLGSSLYVMPWIGVDKNFSENDDININGEIYEVPDTVVFPTVHVGFEF